MERAAAQGWGLDDTKNAAWDTAKRNAAKKGEDSDSVKAPSNQPKSKSTFHSQGIETESFRLFEELVRKPFVDRIRQNMGIDPSNVPQWGRVVLTLDGGVPQMKATMDPKSLDEKVKRLKIQVKIAKNTSGVFQPCDVGNGHVRLGHWVRQIGPDDVPHLGIV